MADIVLLGHDGWATNYKIVPSVAGNNLTVALKTAGGDDPSASDPITVRIGDAEHIITSALSVTKAAGTNWCNSGSSELATKEVDYFVYLGYNATDGMVIGFSRIPYATLYSDFSTTTTNEKYAGISTITSASAGDNYVNIGRFAATLSAGAGYTWTVPTFTSANLIQRPIFETRWLTWLPTRTGYSSIPTDIYYQYQILGKNLYWEVRDNLTGTSNATTNYFTLPMSLDSTLANFAYQSMYTADDNGVALTTPAFGVVNSSFGWGLVAVFTNSAFAAWTAAGNKRIKTGNGTGKIAR